WERPPQSISGFVEPFDTWADMTHLLPREGWREMPRALAYFCNALPDPDHGEDRADPDFPARQREQVRRNAVRFLDHDVVQLWPNASGAPGEFRWELLVDANGGPGTDTGEARFT